jgi:hypothetical protein
MKKCMQCGGATKMKKMAKGSSMKTTVGGPAKKPFAAGIPYFTGAGMTGPESMKTGGSTSAPVQRGCPPGYVRKASGIGCTPMGKR